VFNPGSAPVPTMGVVELFTLMVCGIFSMFPSLKESSVGMGFFNQSTGPWGMKSFDSMTFWSL
jgi:hypothetical protein